MQFDEETRKKIKKSRARLAEAFTAHATLVAEAIGKFHPKSQVGPHKAP
jgi:hypothetical protein